MDYTIAADSTAIGSGDAPPASGSPGEFTNGNPTTNTPATILPGYQMNALVQEIRNVIVAGGITPSRFANNQLYDAIWALIFMAIADEAAVVTSFDGRTGAVTLQWSDVISALGFTPANETDLTAEATNRTNADTTLGTNIYNESVTRSNQDIALQNKIEALFGTINNVTGSRAYFTAFVNSTGRPMFVSVSGAASGASSLSGIVNGSSIINSVQANTGNSIGLGFIVPAGATYQINWNNASSSLSGWWEVY